MSKDFGKRLVSMWSSLESAAEQIGTSQLERIKERTYNGVGASLTAFKDYADERAGRSRPKVAGPTLFDQVRVDVRSSFSDVHVRGITDDQTAAVILLWQNDRRPFLARTERDEQKIAEDVLTALAKGYNGKATG